MPPPAFDWPMPKPKQNKRRKEASQPTSSAMPAPSAPPQLSPIRTTPVPWPYHPQSLAAPPGGSAGPSFTSNGAAAMPPTYAPWNQGSETHPHQVMQWYEPYQRAHINQPPTYLQHAPQQRHDHTHQPWNYRLPTTTAAESQLSHAPFRGHSVSPAREFPPVQTFAMFRHYQLRTTSGSSPSGGSRPAAGRPSPVSQRTISNSSLGSSRGSTPFPGGPPTSSLSGPGRTGPVDYSDPPPATQPSLRSIPRSLRPAASDASSLDEPVSAGVRRPRDTSSDDPGNDLTCLSPRRIKRLKVHAKKLADDLQIPNKSLIEFIETGDLFLMLVDMKASLVKYELSNQTNQLQALQDTLSSKDFELGLHNRLLACLLSPNLTAYVTDTQCHIMDFIFEHLDVFKIPAGVFDDAELRSSLGRIVTRLLATICSQLKSQVN
ncbi:hypothetical protein PAXINDRAFT_22297 [Paxillus involutus ATCC 200175]|uniref:Uncharacterized protein n=1 Tax=Paxillus involutus ATCC 200175 TaxID=664439 RepID=A0A0C9SSA7_PAXIN|nr:hypothetical protein PAXINDRAFT_22297 [Paxillus involutus ATCC 200175]